MKYEKPKIKKIETSKPPISANFSPPPAESSANKEANRQQMGSDNRKDGKKQEDR